MSGKSTSENWQFEIFDHWYMRSKWIWEIKSLHLEVKAKSSPEKIRAMRQ